MTYYVKISFQFLWKLHLARFGHGKTAFYSVKDNIVHYTVNSFQFSFSSPLYLLCGSSHS